MEPTHDKGVVMYQVDVVIHHRNRPIQHTDWKYGAETIEEALAKGMEIARDANAYMVIITVREEYNNGNLGYII
jgi:hypothetical protein